MISLKQLMMDSWRSVGMHDLALSGQSDSQWPLWQGEFHVSPKRFGDPPFELDSPYGGGRTLYASSNPSVAVVRGSIVTITGCGLTTITAVRMPMKERALDAVASELLVTLPPGWLEYDGLIWMRPDRLARSWAACHRHCLPPAGEPPMWRLPTSSELRRLFRSGLLAGSRWPLGYYWSSTRTPGGFHCLVYAMDAEVYVNGDDAASFFATYVSKVQGTAAVRMARYFR